MTQEELALFKESLTKYLAHQSVCIQAKTHKRPRTQTITTRDCQAMRNFSDEGISLETIAEHFGCSVAYVYEQVTEQPWLRTQQNTHTGKNLSWMESDHSDPLEFVKLFYSHYLPAQIAPETTAQEARHEITYQEYLDSVDWDEAWENYGLNASDVVMETAREIAAKSNIELVFTD